MGVVPILDKVQMSLEMLSFVICLCGVVAQLGILDYYFVHYMQSYYWLFWIVADVTVVAVMTWLLFIAICYSKKCMNEKCTDDSNVKYAFLAWLVYSVVLSAKVGVMFTLFADKLSKTETFGPSALKLLLACTAAIFLFLVLSHHYSSLNSPRQTYLSYLASSVTLDVIDSVLFLQLLIDPEVKAQISQRPALTSAILFFACFNFILPTFALFKLRYKKGLPPWMPLPYEKLYTLFYFLTVNLPFLIIRSLLWRNNEKSGDVSVFIVKNFVMVALAVREVWVAYLHWRQKRAMKCTANDSNIRSRTNDGSSSASSSACNVADFRTAGAGGSRVCAL